MKKMRSRERQPDLNVSIDNYGTQDYLPQYVRGKNILITGATTGIGRAFAILLSSRGLKFCTKGSQLLIYLAFRRYETSVNTEVFLFSDCSLYRRRY